MRPFGDMTSDTVILAITAAIAVTVATPGLQPAGASLTVRQVRNSNACLPSVADPPDLMVPFKDGKYASPSIPFAEMRAMAAGQLDGKPAVVSEIVWNTIGPHLIFQMAERWSAGLKSETTRSACTEKIRCTTEPSLPRSSSRRQLSLAARSPRTADVCWPA
jgi:hypothetical protein